MRRLMDRLVPDVALMQIGFVPGYDAASLIDPASWSALAYLFGAAK